MHALIPARLFGGDAPPTGENAQLQVSGGQLVVHGPRGTQRIALDALRVREVVSAVAGIELAWDARGRSFAAHVFDPQALRALQSLPELARLAPLRALRGGARRSRALRVVAWSAGALFVLLPLLLLALFLWQADRIAGALAARIPVAQEQALGRRVFVTMRARLALQDAGAELAAVRSLGARLTAGSRFDYEFHVARDATINAFALPGGIIVVHTGLIEAVKRPEELAGVLAHEVQHVELRHSLRAMVKELGLRGLWAAATGDLGGGIAGEAALKLASLRFSRDAEMQADAAGFDLLVERGIDPSGMVEFVGTLTDAAGPAPPEWASTHPPGAARQEALRARLSRLDGRQFAPLLLNEP